MKIEFGQWSEQKGWRPDFRTIIKPSVQWVLVFGDRSLLSQPEFFDTFRHYFPNAAIQMATTSGEIINQMVLEKTLIYCAVEFKNVRVIGAKTTLDTRDMSRAAGERLINMLPMDGLRHVFVLSDGIIVNGSQLVCGLTSFLPDGVTISGGLAGDGTFFTSTLVGLDEVPKENTIAIVGLYGEDLHISCGSVGGWDPFGMEWTITRSEGSILYDLDGQSALELYKKYLGKYADELPSSGLLFPLSLRIPGSEEPMVRTLLGINEDGGMVLAGDVPQGCFARLMKANFDCLISGASQAAAIGLSGLENAPVELAVMISCVGRKLVLGQRIEEEVEAVNDVIGSDVPKIGFYSYGEISPFKPHARSELHNQTMTVTLFSEKVTDA